MLITAFFFDLASALWISFLKGESLDYLVHIFDDFSFCLVNKLVNRLHKCLDLVESGQDLPALVGHLLEALCIIHHADRMLWVHTYHFLRRLVEVVSLRYGSELVHHLLSLRWRQLMVQLLMLFVH